MVTFPQNGEQGFTARLADAVNRLESLHEGAQSVVDIVRFGRPAVPALRALLFRRDKSGLHQARCRATDALAAIGAYEVLDEYLRSEHHIEDPIERLGEETVMSAAARALARRHDKSTFELLTTLARRKPLTGVLIALGSFKRSGSIPIFVNALAEDEVRITAEAVLRTFGSRARPLLLEAACAEATSESDLRKRRSALGLLGEYRRKTSDWDCVKPLMSSSDLETAILAAGLVLKMGNSEECHHAVDVLHGLRVQADWLRRMQIDQYLQRFGSNTNKLSRQTVTRV
jgi:hypothetical protein